MLRAFSWKLKESGFVTEEEAVWVEDLQMRGLMAYWYITTKMKINQLKCTHVIHTPR